MGIDVGTGSARAGLFDGTGQLLAAAQAPLELLRPVPDHAEYRSGQIWDAAGQASRAAMAAAGAAPGDVAGLGFDATCSLVVVGGGVSVTDDPAVDTIAWLDHRAIEDAAAIDATGHAVLRYVGGTISSEMQMPKLRWLHRQRPEAMAGARFFDLPDWLTFRATGSETRSLCSAVCKWTYQGRQGLAGEGWDQEFLQAIGLGGLAADGFTAIGARFAPPGRRVGAVTDAAAVDLGLAPGTPVGASLIDAYAGALGTLYAGGPGAGRVALIGGTSACHIAVTPDAVFVPGVWGPYWGVLLPGLWALEAGQSAAGALIDRLIDGHGASTATRAAAKADGHGLHARLDDRLAALAGGAERTHELGRRLHVQPDVHGNRAPLADPNRRGAVTGLTLDAGEDDLARLYLAGMQALAHGTRQILDTLADQGVPIQALVVSGGLARSGLYVREHADATGLPVLVPDGDEPVLLGAAMLGRAAAGDGDVEAAMAAMSGDARTIAPRSAARAFHDAKHRVFLRMQDDFSAYETEMDSL